MGCVNIGGSRSEALWNETFGPTAANSVSAAASHLAATRSLPGVIFRRSMHCECLQRVCIPLSLKSHSVNPPWRALYPRCVYTCGPTETFLPTRVTRRVAIEPYAICRYSAGNNTEIINVSRPGRLPEKPACQPSRVAYVLIFAQRFSLEREP